MDPPVTTLIRLESDLVEGTVVDRPNRFVVRVRFDDTPERVFLGDPGALWNVLEPGHDILCKPVEDPDRKTGYDAIAVAVEDIYVSLRAALANDLFLAALKRDALPALEGYRLDRREPPYPDHGRVDALLLGPTGTPAYLEVKSVTHVADGVALFPDRPTERGRRHLGSLRDIAIGEDAEAHLVFVAQRPDAEVVRPHRDIDPDFADALGRAVDAGVAVHAMATAFDPPTYRLVDGELPVELR